MSNCTGYLDVIVDELSYYADKLYITYQDMDADTEERKEYLVQMDLDGTKRKEIMQFPIYDGTNTQARCFRFDKGYMYYLDYEGTLKKVNMKNWKQEPFFESEQNKNLDSFKIYENRIYLQYYDQQQQYIYHLEHDQLSQSDQTVLSISDYGTICSRQDGDHYVPYLINKEGEHKLSDQIGLVSTTDSYFLIDTTHYEDEQATLMLFDWHGNLLDQKKITYQDTHQKYLSLQYTLAENGYYTYVMDDRKQPIFVKFPIENGQIKDYTVIDEGV